MSAEFWVMRMVLPKESATLGMGLESRGPAFQGIPTLSDHLESGALCLLAGGDVVEPVELCGSNEDALIVAEARAARTGEVHVVVMSADPADLGG